MTRMTLVLLLTRSSCTCMHADQADLERASKRLRRRTYPLLSHIYDRTP